MIHHLSLNNSILNHFLAEIRDKNVQKDALRFRKNMERISEFIAFEISKSMNYSEQKIETPLGTSNINLIDEKIVVASILRAGLTMHNGLLNVFDKAENAFISAYREEGEEIKVHVEYLAGPSLDNKTLIIADPMLATGSSIDLVHKALLRNGKPKKIHLAIAIASEQGIKYIQNNMPKNTEIWVAAIDPELNNLSYIIPGLGDAGDLAFGEKI